MIRSLIHPVMVAACLLMAYGGFAQSKDLTAIIDQYVHLYDRGRYSEAEVQALTALQLARQELGETDVRLATLLRDLAEISKSLAKFPNALRLNTEALSLIASARGENHPDLSVLLLERVEIYRSLGRFGEAASAYERAIQLDQHVFAKRGFESGFGGSSLSGLETKMVNSVYDFFDREGSELKDYGRYTYVLIPNPSSRISKLLEVLLETTRFGEKLTFDRRKLNVFYIPVRVGYQDAARDLSTSQIGSAAMVAAPIAGAYYDHEFATDLLNELCDLEPAPRICTTALSEGPYLVTLSKRFSKHRKILGPFLILDLSRIHPDAFRKFVDEVKVQVKQPDFTDLERIQQTRLKILNLVLIAGDWVSAVKPAVADSIELVVPVPQMSD